MDVKLTHLDVGIQMGEAWVRGLKPTIEILCGSNEGDKIWDDWILIQLDGKIAAACDCPDCKAIAKIMHEQACKPREARKIYKRLRSTFKVNIVGGLR